MGRYNIKNLGLAVLLATVIAFSFTSGKIASAAAPTCGTGNTPPCPSGSPSPSPMRIPVSICHRNEGNGWSKITVDDDAVDGNGNEHNDHNMPNHHNGEDIIPPFDTNGNQGSWNPRNWNSQGEATWRNNCVAITQVETLACTGITVDPAFGSGNKFSFGQTYNFTPAITGTPTNYSWSINPTSPALSSTDLSTTSWTAPATANPGVTWTLSLNISDNSDNTASCSINFLDPTDTVTENDVCANIDGVQTSVPSGLHLDASGRNCVDYQYGGPPTGGTSGTVLGASTTGRVLGATTVAKTGVAEDMMGTLLVAMGSVITLTSFYGYKKAFAVASKKK